MKTRLAHAVAIALFLGAIAAPSAVADELSATLDGKRIRIDRVSSLNCHDFDYPVIRCFSTADLIAADIGARLSGEATGARLLLSGYVTAWQDASYGGPSISMSTDQSSLSSLGWNDRISSFKSFGANGGFYEHSPSGGTYYAYGSSTQVSSLGAMNDKFSAFYIS
jgi:hypothetical protein